MVKNKKIKYQSDIRMYKQIAINNLSIYSYLK